MPDAELGLPVVRNWVVHLTDRFAFEHAANSAFDMQAAYAALPASTFATFGSQPGKNLARASLGAEFKSGYGLSAGLQFDEQLSSRSQSYNGIFSLGYGWCSAARQRQDAAAWADTRVRSGRFVP